MNGSSGDKALALPIADRATCREGLWVGGGGLKCFVVFRRVRKIAKSDY
jgi:hypothetical protein